MQIILRGVIPSSFSILTAILVFCVLTHVFSVGKERQCRLLVGKIDEYLLVRADVVLLYKAVLFASKC